MASWRETVEWFWASELPNVIMLRVSDEAARCMPLAGIDEVGGVMCLGHGRRRRDKQMREKMYV